MNDSVKDQNVNDNSLPSVQGGEQEIDQENRRPSFKTEEVAADSKEDAYPANPNLQEISQQSNTEISEQPPTASSATTNVPPANSPLPVPNPAASVLNTQAALELEKVPSEPVLPPRRKGPPKILLIVMVVLLGLVAVLLVITRMRDEISDKDIFGEKGVITWWGIEESETAIKPIIEDYQKDNPSIKITYRQVAREDYRERVTNALASGSGPDIFEIHNSWIPMFKSYLQPAPANVISPAEFSGNFYPVIVSNMSVSEGVVSLPLFYDAMTLFVNEDIFSLAARDYPDTWNELRELVDPKNEGNFTLYGPDKRIIQSGVALGVIDNVDYWQDMIALMMLQNQANMNDPTGAPARDAFIFYKLFADDYNTWDTSLPPSITAFSRGNVAMMFAPSREAITIINSNPNLRFKTVSVPQLVKDKPDDPDVTYANYWSQAVWRQSASREIAWDFLKYMTSSDVLQKLNQTRKTSGQLEKAYPRKDMASLQQNHPILGSVVVQAPYAKSWYLADETNDGASGLNTLLADQFEIILKSGRIGDTEINKFAPEVVKILSQYNINR